ncbi:hypothetical protein ACIOEX_11915 [Streptomyces sp. NPDC087850]|uniref:hypothetical protein n=1 Tax=Streptomyces sp. NPDC087850 TaxID=3365809 RepID=UPI0037F49E2F
MPVLVSALAAASLLTAGCSASPTATESVAEARPAASGSPETSEGAISSERLEVGSVPAGAATPTAVAKANGDGSTTQKSSLTVASYDAETGRAVISGSAALHKRPSVETPEEPEAAETSEPSAEPDGASTEEPPAPSRPTTSSPESPDPSSPDADPGAGSGSDADAAPTAPSDGSGEAGESDESGETPADGAAPEREAVEVGDVIASVPAPGAPDGLLAKVTEVVGEVPEGIEVETAAANLNELLGDDTAEGTVPVDPSSIEVEPLVKGVKVSWAKTGGLTFGPKAAILPMGNLRIDVGTEIATAEGAPASAAASVSGFVQLAPEVEFSYNGSGGSASSPGAAFLGLNGDWASQWRLKGQAAAATEGGKPLRIPFAELHTNPVIQVGPVPIVVNLDLTCYFQIEGDGRINVDVKQDLKGDFRVGGGFSWAKGWKGVSESNMEGVALETSVEAAGKVKAALGAEAAIGLYGTVGVVAEVAPYLRGAAEAVANGSAGGTGSVVGAWQLHGGFDLSGALQLKLSIFGTPLFEKRIPLVALHREWLLREDKGGVATPVAG